MSIGDELAKFAALRDSGHITQEEFEAQKTRLLATPVAPIEGRPSAPAPVWTGSGPARVSKGGGFLRRLLIVLLILAGLALAGTVFRPSSGNTARATDRPAAAAWSVPAGFTRYAGDPNVAWRWAEKGEVTCDVGDSCWGMFVVAKDGCSSLYVEVSIIDSAGTAIDYSNDTTSALEPGQQAKLEFQSFDDGADKARLTQISC